MTDRWTDKSRRTILTFLVNNQKRTVFLKSIAYAISKTTDKFCKILDDIIEEISEKNVVQIITNNVTNYRAICELLMKKGRLSIGPIHSTLH